MENRAFRLSGSLDVNSLDKGSGCRVVGLYVKISGYSYTI